LPKILVVDDDPAVLATIRQWLEAVDHYVVEAVTTAEEARFRLRTYTYDAVILDWELENASGVELCSEYRSEGGSTPVLMLTGKDGFQNRVTGLDAGCDDYLVKPFAPQELSARLRALFRRSAEKFVKTIKLAELEIDPSLRIAVKAGRRLELSAKELDILVFLAQAAGAYFTAVQIINAVWPSESETSPDSVRVHIHKLRAALSSDNSPPYLVSQRHLGYSLQLEKH